MTRAGFGFLCVALLIGAAAAPEPAFADGLSGAYIGGNFGRARNGYDTGFADNQVVALAAGSGDTVTFSDRSVQRMSDAWWVNSGYFFTPYLAIDAAFLHVGEIRYVAVGTAAGAGGNQAFSSSTEISSRGPALSLIGRLPLAENFALDLRVGGYFGKTVFNNTLSVDANSEPASETKTNSSLLAGVGASYTVAGHWSVRVDYLRVNKTGDSDIGKFSVNLATAGVSYTF